MKNIEYLKSGISEIEIRYKNKVKPSEMYQVSNPEDTAKLARLFFDDNTIEHHEQFVVIVLNRANKVLGYVMLASGGVSGVICDPKMVFQICLKSNASGFVCVHNHPSGNTKPSKTDIDYALRLKEAARLLDLTFVDNIILTVEDYYSFANEGII